jgi:hypothetical protein
MHLSPGERRRPASVRSAESRAAEGSSAPERAPAPSIAGAAVSENAGSWATVKDLARAEGALRAGAKSEAKRLGMSVKVLHKARIAALDAGWNVDEILDGRAFDADWAVRPLPVSRARRVRAGGRVFP